MSKKRVKVAIDHERQGRRQQALDALAPVDRSFVLRRLGHLAKFGGADAGAAEALRAVIDPPHPERRPPRAEIDEPTPPSLSPPLSAARSPVDAVLGQPEPFLCWASAPSPPLLRLDQMHVAELWALVGLASAGQRARGQHLPVEVAGTSGAARFAQALGLERVLVGEAALLPAQPARTVPLRRIAAREEIGPAARTVAGLIAGAAEQSSVRKALEYVFIELLRNVVQHSRDPLGGVVGAQLNDQGPHARLPVFQVAVADAGIGIPESLRRMHRVDDPREALERSLWPHISGTFPEGLTGSGENAGLGLFFVAEMAKLASGRMLIATREAALMLTDHATGALAERVGPRFLKPDGVGFPGTLVAFEIPVSSIPDFDAMKEVIHERARSRTPKREVHRWIRFEPTDHPAVVVRVADLAEDTFRAAELAKDRIRPAILQGEVVLLDFDAVEICTQSFLHALLYEPVRLAWATRSTLHAVHAAPAVRSGVEFLERYALGG